MKKCSLVKDVSVAYLHPYVPNSWYLIVAMAILTWNHLYLNADEHVIKPAGHKDMLAQEVASLCRMAQCGVHPDKLRDLITQLPDS